MLYATLASLCILAQVAPPSNSIDERIDRFVRGEMAAQHIPGAAVAVIKNGVTLRAEGYGVANIEHCVPAQRESVFQSGSLGKQFTAAGIMMLVERDKLDLNDPIARHLPSPARWGSITVRHLLTHTSGLPDDEFVLNLRRDYTENQLALFIASLPRRYRPGKHFQYSNLGYALLGMIIGRVSGQFYGDFLRENIFIPAGMHTTRIISEADIVPRRVAGYRVVAKQIKKSGVGCAESQHDGGWGAPRDASRSYRLGAGGPYSSAPKRRELVENFPARDASKRSENLVWICMGVGATRWKRYSLS